MNLENSLSLIQAQRQGEKTLANDVKVKENVLAKMREQLSLGLERIAEERDMMAQNQKTFEEQQARRMREFEEQVRVRLENSERTVRRQLEENRLLKSELEESRQKLEDSRQQDNEELFKLSKQLTAEREKRLDIERRF